MCRTWETDVIPGHWPAMKVPGSDVIAPVTFLAILMTIIIQATTTKWLAGKLGLLVDQ